MDDLDVSPTPAAAEASPVSVRLRAANASDERTLLAWRNDPWIVALSASRRAVTPAEHHRWLEQALDRTLHLLYVIESPPGRGIGSIRFDRESDEAASVSIYLLRPHVGRGIGVAALRDGCTAAFHAWPRLREIRARIRAENDHSIRAFTKAGFREYAEPRSPAVRDSTMGDCDPTRAAIVTMRHLRLLSD